MPTKSSYNEQHTDQNRMSPEAHHELAQTIQGHVSEWIIETHPSLVAEKDCIGKDVVKKILKKILRENLSPSPSELKELLLPITEQECQWAIPSAENRKKNMDLSRKEFKKYLVALQNGDETLIEKIYLAHFPKCVQYLIHRCGSSFDNAHESSLDALLEIRKDLVKEKIFYGNLGFFFTYRAKSKLYKTNLNEKEPFQSIEGLEFEDEEQIEKNVHQNQLRTLLSTALQKLCADCESILKQYYYDERTLKEIAVIMNKKHDAIRQEARRCRNKLRGILGEKFYHQFSSYFDH